MKQIFIQISKATTLILFAVVFVFLFNIRSTSAAGICTVSTGGTWDGTANVSHGTAVFTSCNGANSTPASTDAITIAAGQVLTVTATPGFSLTSITLAANTTVANGLIINDGVTVTVSGALSFTANTGTAAQTVTLGSSTGAGNLTVGSITMPATSGAASTSISKIACGNASNTGTLTVSGAGAIAITGSSTTSGGVSSIDMSGGTCKVVTGTGGVTLTGGSIAAALLKMGGGTLTMNSSLTFGGANSGKSQFTMASTTTVALNSATLPTTVGSSGAYTLASTKITSSSGINTIAYATGVSFGALNVNGTSTLNLNAVNETFASINIASGATLSSIKTITCSGNYTNAGTHTGTGGALNLTGASAAINITGTMSYTGLTSISGASNPSIAANSNFTLASLTLGATSPLSFNSGSGGGSVCGTNLTCMTVTGAFTVTAQTASKSTLNYLGANVLVTINGATTFNQPGTAGVTSTFNIGPGTLTFNGLVTMAGTATTSQISKFSLSTGTINFNAGLTIAGTTPANKVFDLSGGNGTVNVSGAISGFAGATSTPGNQSKWVFSGSTAQTIPMGPTGTSNWGACAVTTSQCYQNLTILNTGGATLAGAITSTNVLGNFTIGDDAVAAIVDNGGFAIGGATGDTFTLNNLSTLKLTGTLENLPSGYTTITYDANSTLEFDQTSSLALTAGTYGDVSFKPASGTPTFTLPATFGINGDLIIGGGAGTPTVTADTNDPTLSVPGVFTIDNGGAFTASSTALLTVTGNTTIGGGASGTFTESGGNVDLNGNLTIAAGATFTKNATSQLQFTKGAAQTIADNTVTKQDLGTIATSTTSTNLSSTTNITATNLIIGTGTTIDISSDTVTLTGGSGTLIANSGTFTTTSSTIIATGSGTKTFASGVTSINNLTISSSGTNETDITSDITIGGALTINTPSVLVDNTANLTVSGSVTNSGTFTVSYSAGFVLVGGNWTNTGTITAGTSTIKMTGASTTPIVFDGGGATYNNVWFAHGAGTGSIEVRGTNTFNDFKDDGTASHSLLFAAGTTTTLTTFTVTGDINHTITIDSSDGAGGASTATHALTKAGGGTISSDYLNIQHSVASPATTWYAGTHSTDNNSVATAGSGWIFTPVSPDGTPHGGVAWSIPGTIQAEDYNDGGEGVAYHDLDTANQAGQYRPSEGVDIETSADTGGGYDVGWIGTAEWMNYTVNVASGGTYTFTARVAAPSAQSMRLKVDGVTTATIAIPSTGGWSTWATTTGTAVALTTGTHVIQTYAVAGGYNLNFITFSSNALPTANAGIDQAVQLPTTTTTLSGSGSDTDGTIASYAWSFISGPATPSITSATSASTGITGLTTVGTYVFRLTVTDNSGGTGTDDINVVVSDTSITTYYVDFGLSTIQTSTTGWNNLSDTTTSGPTLTLVDSAGTTTTRTLHITDSFYYNGTSMDPSMNQNGTSSSTIYPANATHDSFFLGTLNAITDTSAAISVSGLNNASTYDFKFYASRVAGDAGNRTTDYTIGATTVSLNATDNVDNTVQITGVTPTAGSIGISINKNASATFGYLGVLQITEHAAGNVAPTANAGVDQSVTMPVSSITLSGSGTDTDGTIASYAWSEVSSNYATINSPTSASTTVKDLAAGTYTFRLTVTDNLGATGTDDMIVTVANHSLTTPTAKTIVVLGSSTSAGYGITPSSDAYVNRFATYFDGLVASNSVVNLAVSGYTTYQLLPTGSSTPSRPAPDTAKNITAALTYNPAAILVNLPSNDTANGYSVTEQETNFQTMASTAASAGVPIYFTTTQPRNNFTAGQVTDQTTVRDWILSTYGTKAIDFWTTFAQGDGTINPIYDQGDGIHLNNVAHKKLYARVAESTMITVVHNNAPVANAGVDQPINLPTTTATLSGSGSDTDGTIASYSWSFISGPAAPSITSASTASTGITGLTATGTYVFRLTVTDNLGKTATDDINVVISAASTACTSQATGNWNTTGTWSCGHVPTTGDDVTIAVGHVVSVDVDSATLGAIIVNGTLNTGSHAITGTSLTINASGTFYTGASAVTMSGSITNSGTFAASPWQNYRVITIDHTKVPNTDLSNFPVLINGTYASLKTTGNGGKVTNASGYDIAFFSDSALATPLKFEREKWVASTGELLAWVKIPTLSHTVDTTIYMAYGNSAVTTDQSDKNNVWDANYTAVWHMNDTVTGTGQTILNSTVSSENITTTSSGTYSGGSITAKVGNGISTKQVTGDYLTYPQITLTGDWTIEGWANLGGYPDQYESFFSNGTASSGLIYNTNWYARLYRSYDGGSGVGGMGDNIVAPAGSETSTGVWNHYVITRSGTALTMYQDGNQIQTSANGRNAIFRYLAMRADNIVSNDINFDEVRISTALRSADWVKTEFNNQNSPSTFYSVGTERAATAGSNLTVSTAGSWTNTGTFSGGSATIKMTDNSANPTFAGGGATYSTLWLAPGTGAGTYTISGNNTFGELKDDGTAAHTIKFTAGSTQTISTWTISGSSGNLITLNSTTTGTYNLVKATNASETRADYLNIQHSIATPYNSWYAGDNSVDNQNLSSSGSGWLFATRSRHRGGGAVQAAGGETSNGTGTGTCADGIQNGNETGIDTGGRCANTGGGTGGGGTVDNGTGTGTCADGIQNGNETGIDQGGRCINTGGGSGGGGGDVGFIFFFQQITLPSMSMWFTLR